MIFDRVRLLQIRCVCSFFSATNSLTLFFHHHRRRRRRCRHFWGFCVRIIEAILAPKFGKNYICREMRRRSRRRRRWSKTKWKKNTDEWYFLACARIYFRHTGSEYRMRAVNSAISIWLSKRFAVEIISIRWMLCRHIERYQKKTKKWNEKKEEEKKRENMAATKIHLAMKRVCFSGIRRSTHMTMALVVGSSVLEARTCLLYIFAKHLTSQTVL